MGPGDRCYHVPTSPGQKVCTCLDEIMTLRLTVELLARRIVQLERDNQRGEIVLYFGGTDDEDLGS